MSASVPALGAPPANVRTRAALLLFAANIFWGWSFPTMKWVVPEMQAQVPGAGELVATATFIGWRFGLGGLLYLLLSFRTQRGFTREEWRGGLATGLCFVTGLFLQIMGLRYTLPSISGFITSLVVVFIPLAQRLVLRTPIAPGTWPAVGLALAGTVVLATTGAGDPSARPPFPYAGEVLTLLGSVAFTAQVLFLDHYGKKASATRVSLVQFAVTGLAGVLIGLALGHGPDFYQPATLHALGSNWTIQWGLPTLVVFSTVGAFHLMNQNQPLLPAATAGVIYCSEPVFSTVFSIVLGQESPAANLLMGGGLILAGIVWINRPARRNKAESVLSTG
ncbi:MAG: DMT family transporter [Planctomycetota bacterium]|nr:DMT family transporter [Planctomycetota bacterium]